MSWSTLRSFTSAAQKTKLVNLCFFNDPTRSYEIFLSKSCYSRIRVFWLDKNGQDLKQTAQILKFKLRITYVKKYRIRSSLAFCLRPELQLKSDCSWKLSTPVHDDATLPSNSTCFQILIYSRWRKRNWFIALGIYFCQTSVKLKVDLG